MTSKLAGPENQTGAHAAEAIAEEAADEERVPSDGRDAMSRAQRKAWRERLNDKAARQWGGELRKHFSKERCSQTAMPFFAVFPLYFGLFLSPVQNQMHR